MDLRDSQDLARAFAEQYGDDLNPFVGLARVLEECGEVAAEIARIEGSGSKGFSGQRGDVQSLRAELADVLINIAGLANSYGLDLAEAMEHKREAFIALHGQAIVDRNKTSYILHDPPAAHEPLRVTVFCSSSNHVHPEYIEAATELGDRLGEKGYTVVYGGGSRGMMGAVSRAAHRRGSRVHGIILDAFRVSGGDNTHVDALHVVSSMWTRKRGLVESGDVVVALPGGFGTFEELLEVLSLRQIGMQPRPVVLMNTRGYFDPLLAMFERCRDEGFGHPMPEGAGPHYQVAETPEQVMAMIEGAAR